MSQYHSIYFFCYLLLTVFHSFPIFWNFWCISVSYFREYSQFVWSMLWIYLSVCLHVYTRVILVYVWCMCLCPYVPVCIYLCIYVFVGMCVFVCICMYVWLWVYVCVHTCACVCVCAHARTHMSAGVCRCLGTRGSCCWRFFLNHSSSEIETRSLTEPGTCQVLLNYLAIRSCLSS